MKTMTRAKLVSRSLLVLAVLATVGCDRVTKHAASVALADGAAKSYLSGAVSLAYTENAGGFLSLGASLPDPLRSLIFVGAAAIMLVGLVVFAFRSRWNAWQMTGLALFAAGGASNLIDRIVHGSVVDFMRVGVGVLSTGWFNVADVALTIGFCLLVTAGVRDAARKRPEAPK